MTIYLILLKRVKYMNINISRWKEFKISDIFNIRYGLNLELNNCEEVDFDFPNSVNFVSRTAENNGIATRVKIINGVEPQKAGLVTVAGGGSVLSTFLQIEPFYSGRDLYVLESKNDISNEAKLFIITIIKKNKYKYSYGRQANRTLQDIILELPVDFYGNPDYDFMTKYIESLHSKPIKTKIKKILDNKLCVNEWKEFVFERIFNIRRGESLYITDLEVGSTPYASATSYNNGISAYLNVLPNRKGNCIAINYDGSVGNAYYHEKEFFASEKIATLTFKETEMNKYNALFVISIIKKEKYRFSYGRKWAVESSMKKAIIKLPIVHTSNGDPYIDSKFYYSDEGYIPDWKFMEEYIKSLPYSDRI